MLVVLRALVRPWRVVRRVRVLKDAIVTLLHQVLNLQREVWAEVRELHRSGLLTAIRVIEEQQRTHELLAQDNARLEQRLAALEQRLDAADPSGVSGASGTGAPAAGSDRPAR
jgi:hypothetical protein